MMSKKSPQLRFEGFTDDWEERKLSSISERVTRKNKNNESTLPLTISAQDGLIDQNDFFNKQVASRDVTGYFLVKNGEFAYNKSYSNGYPWGAIKRLDKYDMGVLSTLYIVFRPTEINSQFLVSYYDTTRWYREVSKNAAEGARNHGLLNIAPTDFFNTLLVVPKIVDEQEKIGSFFKQMDNTIALHQRKLDLLKEQKKGYLQKMFPKNGEKVPELRFAGFADDWEERKLGDEVNINGRIGFRGYTQADIVTKETGVLAYSPTNIVNNRLYRKRSDTYITKQKYRESPEIMVKNSDILFVKTGSTLGKSALVQSINYHATVNPQIVIIRSNELDEYFLSVILTSYNILKRINTIKIGGAIPTMTETELKKFPIQVPKSTEQKKIGSFFKQLDNTIALHQRKLDLLKEQKKGFLQKMFPKNGAKVPELRFAGFADDWEERKFSDFTKLSQGLQIAISDRFTEAGPNKEFYITNEFLNPNNTKKYYIENPSKNVIANKNDILMTRTGNTGKVVTNTKGAFHNNFFKIDYDPQKISKLFLYFLLTSIPIQKEILIRAGTSTIPDLNHKDFYNIKVYLPIFEEQQRIGSFFKQLDDTIALHQRKLDLLKEQKKGFLQKMFV